MSLTAWLRGTGRRRAADRIPVLTAERDQWMLLALLQAHELAGTKQQNAKLTAGNEILAAKLEGTIIERNDALDAYEEAAARAREALADLANLRAITTPAPIDGGHVVLRDFDDTVETPVMTLFEAHGQAAA
jgi:hypothetical protein